MRHCLAIRLTIRLAILLALGPTAELTAAVLRVGPTRTHKKIQAAVNAARSGDLVVVDAGTYAGFAIAGKGISVVPATTFFTVTVPNNAPGILVRGVSYPAQVSIVGARMTYRSAAQPAVRVTGNTGAVRFSQLHIDLAADLCQTTQPAAVVVEVTKTFWLIDSRIFTGTARKATTLVPLGKNDGVSGMFVKDSDGIVQNCHVRGYDACKDYAGDGLRMTGNTSIWILDDYANSPQRSIFQGGNGGKFGGNGLHYLGARTGLNRITQCGRALLQGGNGSSKKGGKFALNNDGGQPRPGIWRLPRICSGNSLLQTSTDAPVAALKSNIRMRIFSVVNRNYLTFVSINSRYRRNLLGLGLQGRGVLDASAPITALLAAGRNTAWKTTVLNFAVPNLTSLVGIQLTFQSLHGASATAMNALGFPSMTVITP